jgi:aryl-alcohol dehydrogenase-like predicted oxidoreductase
MRNVFLGSTGLKVSELCLGTTGFGTQVPNEESGRIWNRCIDAGVNFFDTANAAPESEHMVGKLSKGRRHSLVISTKVFQRTGPAENDVGLSRKHIVRACDDSLRRLQTDYIDVYLAHSDDVLTPVEETLSALDHLVRQGKVLYIGASNYSAWRLNEALWVSVTRNYPRYCCMQALFNLQQRDIETEILPMCDQKDVGVIAWSPLARGSLTDAALPEGEPGDGHQEAKRIRHGVHAALAEVARQVGRPMAQVALRWVLSRRGIAVAALGASSLQQVEENLGVSDLDLSVDHLALLDACSAPVRPYPANIELLVRGLRSPG